MLYGLDIGGTKIELAAFDHSQKRVFSKRTPTPTDSYDNLKSTLKELVLAADAKLNTRGHIGIGIPGFIDPHTHRATCANIPCASGQPLQTDFEQLLGRPVKIENDANCFALSEALGGAGEGFDSVFGVILGTGCGGGLFLDGRIYSGFNNLAGEWGHTPLSYHAFQLADEELPIVDCGCGLKGCQDNYLSGRGLELIYRHVSGTQGSSQEITQLFRDNDPAAEKAVQIYCELLASGLGNMINIIDPGVIVLGGGLSNFKELYELIPPLLKKYTLGIGRFPEIRPAVFGDSGGVRGAAMLNS